MQPLQYNFPLSAAKDNSKKHAVAAERKINVATSPRSAETESQSTIELHTKRIDVAAPKPEPVHSHSPAIDRRWVAKRHRIDLARRSATWSWRSNSIAICNHCLAKQNGTDVVMWQCHEAVIMIGLLLRPIFRVTEDFAKQILWWSYHYHINHIQSYHFIGFIWIRSGANWQIETGFPKDFGKFPLKPWFPLISEPPKTQKTLVSSEISRSAKLQAQVFDLPDPGMTWNGKQVAPRAPRAPQERLGSSPFGC